MSEEWGIDTALNIAQLIALVGGGFVAVLMTMQRLAEIRDAVMELGRRMSGVEQRTARLEGKIDVAR